MQAQDTEKPLFTPNGLPCMTHKQGYESECGASQKGRQDAGGSRTLEERVAAPPEMKE